MPAPHKRRIGLLGGSFNPPHVCHVLASVYWLETADLDAVWWLPVHRHAFAKDRGLAPFADRLDLARAAVAPWPRIEVDPIEASLEAPSYTIRTVEALRAAHPDCAFSWLAGADILPELPLWHRWPELRDALRFLVIGRAGHAAEVPDGADVVLREFPLPDVSSTAIRDALRAGEDVSTLVPAGVSALLAERPELYR